MREKQCQTSKDLSPEEREAISNFINGKSIKADDACLVCGSSDSRVGSAILSIPAGAPGTIIGASYQPVVSVICHNCGFIRYFHAGPLGLAPETLPVED